GWWVMSRKSEVGSRKPNPPRPTRRKLVGRPAPVRGTAPNKHRHASPDGISEAKPAPKSPDHQPERKQSGDRRLFEAPPRTNTETRHQTGSDRARGPRSRPTIKQSGSSRATGACSGH